MDTNKCKHPRCNCTVGEDKQYCSDACRELAESNARGLRCDCGHADCASKS